MGENVLYSNKFNNLGVIIDDSLSWAPQVSSVCQKVNMCLHHLYIFRAVTPHETRLRLINTLIMPHFDYCDFVYGDIDVECMSRLQKAQNRAVRYVCDVKTREHITPYYVKLSLLKIKERHDLHSLIMTNKILNNYSHGYLCGFFTSMRNVREQHTRTHRHYLQAPRVGRGVSAKSFMVRAYRLWNDLPQSIWDCVSTNVFKSRVDKILCKKYITVKLQLYYILCAL